MTRKVTVPARLSRAGLVSTRAAPGDAEGDDRRVVLTFSSEEPVLRYFGWEVLGHGEAECDLARLQSGNAPLLLDHYESLDSQVGVVEKAEISEGRGTAVVRFGRSAKADEILARVRDGEISNTSVGYRITSLVQIGHRDGEPVYRARWQPSEISLVSVPADTSVGIGRSDDSTTTKTFTLETESSMTPEEIAAAEAATRAAAEAAAAQTRTNPAQPHNPAADLSAERNRVREIRAAGSQFNLPTEMVDSALNDGTPVAAFQRKVLDHIGSDTSTATRQRQTTIGLTDKEVGRFSLIRALRFLANPTDSAARKAAAFEIEVSEAAQSTLKRSAQGILVPADILDAQGFARSQTVGTAAAGGNLVGTTHLESSFIELLRKRSALSQLGVRTLTGLSGNVDIPRQTGGATAYWVGESADPTSSGLTFDKVAMTPHTLAAQVPISRRALIQTSPGIEALVRDDLIRTMALAMDHCGINGNADVDAPDGLLDIAGINVVDTGTAITTGTGLQDFLIDLESAIYSNDADVADMKYLFNATVRGLIKKLKDADGRPLNVMVDGQINGYGSVMSNNAPAANALFGNWSDFIIGMWSGLDLTVDNAALAASGGVVLRAFQDVDFAVRHAKSFARAYDAP